MAFEHACKLTAPKLAPLASNLRRPAQHGHALHRTFTAPSDDNEPILHTRRTIRLGAPSRPRPGLHVAMDCCRVHLCTLQHSVKACEMIAAGALTRSGRSLTPCLARVRNDVTPGLRIASASWRTMLRLTNLTGQVPWHAISCYFYVSMHTPSLESDCSCGDLPQSSDWVAHSSCLDHVCLSAALCPVIDRLACLQEPSARLGLAVPAD